MVIHNKTSQPHGGARAKIPALSKSCEYVAGEPWRSVPNLFSIHLKVPFERHFTKKPKSSTHGRVTGSKIIRIHPLGNLNVCKFHGKKLFEIFLSETKWQSDTTVQSHAASMAINDQHIHHTERLPCSAFKYIIQCVQIHSFEEGGGLL